MFLFKLCRVAEPNHRTYLTGVGICLSIAEFGSADLLAVAEPFHPPERSPHLSKATENNETHRYKKQSRKTPVMCYAVKCNNCNKTTWAGCGMHIASVKASVPPEQWCECSFSERSRDSGCGCVLQ